MSAQSAYEHVPVLLSEVLDLLQPKPGGRYVDATLGGGGYTAELLKASAPDGRVLAVDLDPAAHEHAAERFRAEIASGRLVLSHANFRNLDDVTDRHGMKTLSGVCADLGLSSYQLDQSGRGVSFRKRELLDMRMNPGAETPDARFLLERSSEQELVALLKAYGEEPHAARIARAVVRQREAEPIRYADDFAALVRGAVPGPAKRRADDSVRRVFQALRIAVNHELDALAEFLPKAFDLLEPGGRLAVVSFHSLEDRTVKRFFRELATGCVCPPDFPLCRCGRKPRAKLVTKRGVRPGDQEVAENSRSKPATLRAVEKL